MIKVSLEEEVQENEDVWLVMTGTPYNQEFQKELKQLIPPSERTWVKADTAWKFSADYQVEVIELLEKHFEGVDIDV